MVLRETVTRRLAIWLLLCLTAAAAGADPPGHGVILQYHHVDLKTPPVTTIAPELFAAHLAHLDREGYRVWPLERLVAATLGGEPVPDRTVAITFDDAYTSILGTALPLLKRHGYPFTLFVATDLIGSNDLVYMNWDQVRQVRDAGGLIANHTRSHLHMLRRSAGESEAQWRIRIEEEVVAAGEIIERETGHNPRLFAYPFGEYDNGVKALVHELGYVALGQQSGPISRWSDPGALPRFPMSGVYGSIDTLKDKLDSLPLPVTGTAHGVDPLLPAGELYPTLTVELQPGTYARARLACYATGQGSIPVRWLTDHRFEARAEAPVPVGRSRYNCTMPGADTSRYQWYSQIWIRRRDDGSWYVE